MRRLQRASLLAALALAGCAAPKPPAPPAAIASLQPTAGNLARGVLRLVQVGDRLHVNGQILGLKPNAEHGFHVHERGDCTAADASSAGDHFNPGRQPHGRFDARAHHSGDLPSVRADSAGAAIVDFETTELRIDGGPNDIVGRALVIHRDRDDYRVPAGNAGPALACAVIVRSDSRKAP